MFKETKNNLPLVSIITVNYNGRKFLNECLASLYEVRYPQERLEVIMVDNGSSDDSIEFVRQSFPAVKIIVSGENNYARANNLGIKAAQGEYLAFVNNDITVDKDWLEELVGCFKGNTAVGAASSKILFKDKITIQGAGQKQFKNFYWGDRGFRHEDKGQYEHIEEVLSLCGAAVLFRKSCLDEIGLFDEDFIMYLEDVDMCFRCSKNKWKVLYVPKGIVKHHFRGTSSVESVRYFSERNRLLLIAKHFPMQLGEALYGKGYWTEGENSIYDIFPLIFAKLFECQRMDAIKANLPVIFKKFKNISILEKSILIDRIEEFKNIITQNKVLIAELSRANAQLQEQAQRTAKDLELKDSLLREKETASLELSRANAQLQEQAQRTAKDLELKDSLLREKETELNQKEIQLHEIKEELMISKDDLEKIVRFDQKIKILLVKSQRVTIGDAEETIRIIKKKYPNSSIYLFADLLKQDYEKLMKNNNVETSLIHCQNGSKSLIETPKLYSKLFLTRFDMAVALLSHKQAEIHLDYKKAKRITTLSNSKNQCVYYVD